jgi:hypothetical protein
VENLDLGFKICINMEDRTRKKPNSSQLDQNGCLWFRNFENRVETEILKMILFKFEIFKCKFEQILFYFSKLQFFNFSFSKIFKTEFFVFWVNWVKIGQSLWFHNF